MPPGKPEAGGPSSKRGVHRNTSAVLFPRRTQARRVVGAAAQTNKRGGGGGGGALGHDLAGGRPPRGRSVGRWPPPEAWRAASRQEPLRRPPRPTKSRPPSGGSGACGTRTSQGTTQLGVAASRVFHFHTTQEWRKKCKGGGPQPAFFRSVKAVSVSGTATCPVRLPCSSTPPSLSPRPSALPQERPRPRPLSGQDPPPVDRPGHLVDLLCVELIKAATRQVRRSSRHTSSRGRSGRIASRRTGRRGRTAGPAPRSPGSCRFTAAGGWFGNSSSLRSCRLISVCRSLPLSASHRPAAAPPPTPHRCPFCSRRGTFTESWTDGRTAPLRSSRAEGGRSGQRFPGGFVDFLGRSEEAASPWDPRSSGEYLPRPEKPAPGRLAFSPGPPIRPR